MKQIEFNPSEDVHAVVDDARRSEPSDEGFSELPGTPVQAPNDCWITFSISLSRPAAVWSAVRIVTGLVPREVLHWRLIVPGVETSKRVSCGQAVPPDRVAACRMSPTAEPSAYAPAEPAVTCSRNIHAMAADAARWKRRKVWNLIVVSPVCAPVRLRPVRGTVRRAYGGCLQHGMCVSPCRTPQTCSNPASRFQRWCAGHGRCGTFPRPRRPLRILLRAIAPETRPPPRRHSILAYRL